MVKHFKKLLLQNQKADDLGAWYVTFWMLGLPVCLNDEPRLQDTRYKNLEMFIFL